MSEKETYKLLKRYPGLPKGWNIGTTITLNDGDHVCYEGKFHSVRNDDVRNYPDFWEKIDNPQSTQTQE